MGCAGSILASAESLLMKIIFGLGNPGQKYKNNRHNIGWLLVDALVKRKKENFKRSLRFNAYLAKDKFNTHEVLFIKPRTFMNKSGLCVRKIFDQYKVLSEDVLVIYDDADLPLGKIRLRKSGSASGHRGMRSIIEALGTDKINRLRIGIGFCRGSDLCDYVLSDFSSQDRLILQKVIAKSVSACRDWINQGIDYAMRTYNCR